MHVCKSSYTALWSRLKIKDSVVQEEGYPDMRVSNDLLSLTCFFAFYLRNNTYRSQ